MVCAILSGWAVTGGRAADRLDFNREARRILSDNCFKCHGPDAKERKGGKKGLRLDTADGARADFGGHSAVVPRHPEKSELIRRITTSDVDDKMPPPSSGKKLGPEEIALLQKWIEQGAEYARHWSHVPPARPALPTVADRAWPRNPIDYFILARLEAEGLQPAPEAERAAILRRVSLDLTGLPPALEEVDQFVSDRSAGAYERMVDRLLEKESFGEHWARLWLDQARYADSSGYADDPARTIWAFRDYVIRSLNANKPFDQFTLEQIAGDLLPDPTDEQLVATAFHRNTLTNNEGGTNDEEFRNVAIVDRVNTTMAVWMGTTMGCAQCHDHKFDPISQQDYFRLFAILNNTEDADRADESPVLALYSKEQKARRVELQTEIARLGKIVRTVTPELAKAQGGWESSFETDLSWRTAQPSVFKSQAGAAMTPGEQGAIRVEQGGKTDTYTFEIPLPTNAILTGLRLETLPDQRPPGGGVGHAAGNFVITRVLGSIIPPDAARPAGRYVRIEIPGQTKILSLAEVQVFRGSNNVALHGEASQSSTASDGPAKLAIDGNTDGDYMKARSTTHTDISANPWWEVDLKSAQSIDRVVLWNRTDSGLQERLSDFRILFLNEKREPLWQQAVKAPPRPSAEFAVNGARNLPFASARADYAQKDFDATNVLAGVPNKGWSVAPQFGQPHTLTLLLAAPAEAAAGSKLAVTVEQLSSFDYATVSQLRLAISEDPRASELVRTPPAVLATVRTKPEQRTDAQREELARYYRSIAPGLKTERDQLATAEKQFSDIKPYTTVPVLRELAGDQRRKTRVQRRGNFLDTGAEVTEGLPSAFLPPDRSELGRVALARWLTDRSNPLTARVVVNRSWQSIFGIGLVRTSEEFGAQGEPPSHPELLDWLATELMDQKWDIKGLLKLMVNSAAYRQSSRVTPDLAARDPENRWLARGPRFRLSAEMIRDQAMVVSGLLSRKLYGAPVKPAQPKLGLSAAFGSGTDWETSAGEDRYRRALYTTWRRSNPYPSMATFDAPSREVCTVQRDRSNTPLQALVTLNDPVYVEAAQALARRMAAAGSAPADKARYGFRLCLARRPTEPELAGLVRLYERSRDRFVAQPVKAKSVATQPIGEAPAGSDVVELAAWTVVGNVLLNLDEMLMKR